MSTLERTVMVVRRHIQVATQQAGVDLTPQLWRLDELVEAQVSSPSPRGRLGGLELEREVWLHQVGECLLPSSRELIAESIRATRGARRAEGDPWAALDPEFIADRVLARQMIWTRAEVAALEACRRYEVTSKVTYLRTAVARLERAASAAKARQEVRMTVGSASLERDRLGTALEGALQEDPRKFFVEHVRSNLGGPGSHGGQQLLSDESWTFDRPWYFPDLRGVFAPEFQAVYDAAWRDELERRAEDERRRAEGAETRRAENAHTSSSADGAEDMEPESEGSEEGEEAGATVPADPQPDVGRALVLVHLPTGDEWLEPAMAASCNADLDRLRKKEEARAAYEEVRRDYYFTIGKPYPD